MATIVKKAKIHTPAASVWEKVARVDDVPALTDMIESSEVDGSTRVCVMRGGGELRETILTVDHELRRVAYRIDESPFPIEAHAASIVVEGDEESAVVTWTTDLTPDSARDQFAEAADAMFASMLAKVSAH